MKGLLLKEFYILRNTLIMVALFWMAMMVLLLYSIGGNDAEFANRLALLSIPSLYVNMLPISALSLDERAAWPRYALITPVCRVKLVLVKYLTGIVLMLTLAALSVLALLFMSELRLSAILFGMVPTLCASLLVPAILLPLSFRFGTEKTRILLMLIAGAAGAFITTSAAVNMDWIVSPFSAAVYFAAPILYGLSIFLSIRIYQKKDFS